MNLDNPWILARLVCALATALTAVYACKTSLAVMRRFRVGETNEGQVALARRAELIAATVEFALFGSLIGFVLSIAVADRLADSVRGAMCAFGVFEATGRETLITAAVSVIACLGWRALHRADLALMKPTYTRHKFAGVLALTPILLLDLAAVMRFASELDLTVVSTCCSVSLDSGQATSTLLTADAQPIFIAFVIAAIVAAVSLAVVATKPTLVAVAIPASVIALALALPAIAGFVAPHVYETPNHRCVYCLLRADGLYLGWPMLGAWLVALSRTIDLAMGALLGRLTPLAAAPGKRRARIGSAAWVIFIGLTLFPIVRFAIVTGHADLFAR